MNMRAYVGIPLFAVAIAVMAGLFANPYAATNAQDATPAGDGNGQEIPLRDIGGRDVGVVTVSDAPGGLAMAVSVSGLALGDHGIHFHEAGLCEPNGESAFASAGAHVNPTGMMHGGTPAADAALADQARHAGDLGNLTADAAGIATLSITIPEITLAAGPYTLADADGTALVIHESPDDLTTDPSGASGNRLACAVIAPPQSSAASPAASPGADTGVTGSPADLASPAASPAAVGGGSPNSVTITAIDIDFVEKELTIAADTDTTFVITNEGAAAHNVSIDALNFSVDVQPGETVEAVVNAPAGTYEYYCNVPGHAAAGQVGTLTVQ